jgi:hypothetical protein
MRAAILLALLGSGCGAISFDVEQPVPEQTVQGNPLGGLLPSFIPSPFRLNIDIEQETKKRSTGPASSAGLKALRFSATPPGMPSGTFDFVDEIHVFIAAASLPKVEIARLTPVPKGQTSIELVTSPEVNLLPYVNAGAEMSATATGRQPTSTFTFNGLVTITIRI